MGLALEVVSILERTSITKEALEVLLDPCHLPLSSLLNFSVL